jgi:hypothetical protein
VGAVVFCAPESAVQEDHQRRGASRRPGRAAGQPQVGDVLGPRSVTERYVRRRSRPGQYCSRVRGFLRNGWGIRPSVAASLPVIGAAESNSCRSFARLYVDGGRGQREQPVI